MTAFGLAFGVALLATGALLPALRAGGLHDVPNARSSHADVTPRGGGLAVLVAVCVAVLGVNGWTTTAAAVVGAACLLGVVGLVDDVRSLSARVRLPIQALVGLGLGVALAPHAGDAQWVPLVVVLAVLAVTAYVNAFNFMDGVNGISALNAAVAGGWYAWLGVERGLPVVTVLGAALAGAALGFLPWNARGRVFLGDVGSYGIGAYVAATAVTALTAGAPAPLVVAPVIIYLADTGWVLVTRARRGQPLTEAHRDHVYQRVVRAGWSHLASAGWTASFTAGVCLVIAAWSESSGLLALVAGAALVTVYLNTPRLLQGSRGRVRVG